MIQTLGINLFSIMKKILLLLCFLTLAACAAPKALKGFDSDFDGDKSWTELQAQLPAYPKAENLLPFDAGPASNNLHYIDAPSIVVGEGFHSALCAGNQITRRRDECELRGDAVCDRWPVREHARAKILILKFQVTEKALRHWPRR